MNPSVGEWLVTQWTSRFSEILLTMGDVKPEMTVDSLDEAVLPPDLQWWKQPFDNAPDSIIWTGVTPETQDAVGTLVLVAAGVDSAPSAEIQSTYLELLRQSLSGLAQDIGTRAGRTTNCKAGSETAPDAPSFLTFKIKAKLPAGAVTFYLVLTASLCEQMESAESAGQAKAQLSPYGTPAQGNALAKSSELEVATGSRTFDLLLDVELPVSVSFGRALLKLNDALRLISGSLIELDRALSDPVELLVNNCVIARGEVVVIEGNYGIRVTEIVSQKERLQQSRRFMLP